MSDFYTAPDGNGDDTIWLKRYSGDDLAVLRAVDLPPAALVFWPLIIEGFTKAGTR